MGGVRKAGGCSTIELVHNTSRAAEQALVNDSELRIWLNDRKKIIISKISDNLSFMRKEVLNIKSSYALRRPKDILQNKAIQIEELTQRLDRAGKNRFSDCVGQVQHLQKRLSTLNPENVLNRGFAMIEKEGANISSVRLVEVKDLINIKLKDGYIESKVTGIDHGK